jgi:hypothetical protein
MKAWSLAAALAATLALAVAAPRSAAAFEGQHHLGLGPGLGMLRIDDKSTMSIGGGAGIHYAYGLNDTFNLMAEGSSMVLALNQDQDTPTSPFTRPARIDGLGLGACYVIDILRYVPYVGLMGTGHMMSGGTLTGNKPLGGAALAVGLDYQFDRSWAAGVAIRQHFLLSEMSTYPSFTTAFLRVEHTWGF